MNPVLRTLAPLTMAFAVASCSWFDKDDDELKPTRLVDIEAKVEVDKLWSVNLGKGAEYLRVGLQPASNGARIFAASRDGNVFAIDPDTGNTVWRSELDTHLSAGPGVGEGIVVVAAADGFLVALDADSGDELWRADIAGESLSRPLIDSGLVVVLTIDNRLRALSAFDGSDRWIVEKSTPSLTMRGSAAPILVGTTVIAGFDNGRLVAVNIADGAEAWDTLISAAAGKSDLERLADVDGQIGVVGQDIYASGYHGAVAAIAVESGQMLWAREVSSYEGVAADWNNLYTVDDEGVVIAMTRRNGDETWRQTSLVRREPTVPVPYQATVVVGDFEGYLHFFSNFDGDPVARVRAGKAAVSVAPVAVGGRLLVQGDDGKLTAYAIEQPDTPGNVPAISDDDA